MIKLLREQYDKRTADPDKELSEYQSSIDSFSIINDPNFKPKKETDLSLSELNESLSALNESLDYFNYLWVIKNLVKEIEMFMESPDDLILNLELLYSDFENLQDKLNKLDSNLVIKLELSNRCTQLFDELWTELQNGFHKYLPTSEKIVPVIDDTKFDDFLVWVEKFGNLRDKIDINELLSEYKLVWESYILGLSFKKLSLDGSMLRIEDSDGSVLSILTSILSFIQFINILNLQSLRNLYLPKISNKLINSISENINQLIDPSTKEYEILIKIIETAEETNWKLSLHLTVENFDQKLQIIFNDWIMDNYIDKIRSELKKVTFNDITEIKWQLDGTRLDNIEQQINSMEKKIDRALSDERVPTKGQRDDWDDEWKEDWDDNDAQKSGQNQEEEDGWDDWNAWDEDKTDDKKPAQITPKVKPVQQEPKPLGSESITTTIKISQLPIKLIEILNDFQIDSTCDFDPLVSTILSLSSITYPHLSQSFLLYNDLQYLSKNIAYDRIANYAENLVNRYKREISMKLMQILVRISEEENNQPVFEDVESWFQSIFKTDLSQTNFLKFKEIIHYAIDFIANWVLNIILSCNDITELKSNNLTKLIDHLDKLFTAHLSNVNEQEKLESMNKLANVRFLINNHLVDIIERFYQGEFYNIATDEIVSLLRSCFIKSELRDNYINEIVEFRNIS